MIVCGFQGIGKSTIAGRLKTIDLESGNFFVNGKRPDCWFIIYCNIARHLSSQGYTVLVSSHEVVRKYLKMFCNDQYITAIVPDESLKDCWIKKLSTRYDTTRLEKDYKAMLNAIDRFTENTREIRADFPNAYVIEKMDYRFEDIIDVLMDEERNWKNNPDHTIY